MALVRAPLLGSQERKLQLQGMPLAPDHELLHMAEAIVGTLVLKLLLMVFLLLLLEPVETTRGVTRQELHHLVHMMLLLQAALS
jgi:hypothetical protein